MCPDEVFCWVHYKSHFCTSRHFQRQPSNMCCILFLVIIHSTQTQAVHLIIAGWRGNGQTCQEIDECAEGTSGCDHTCINLPGTYQCACDEGFNLVSEHGMASVQWLLFEALLLRFMELCTVSLPSWPFCMQAACTLVTVTALALQNSVQLYSQTSLWFGE